MCRERCLFDQIRGSDIGNFLEVLAFYNIIEMEKPKAVGSDAKKDFKTTRFSLKVEFNELKTELEKFLRA